MALDVSGIIFSYALTLSLGVFLKIGYGYWTQQRPSNKLFGDVAKDSKCIIMLSSLMLNQKLLQISKNYPFVKGKAKVHWHPLLKFTGEGDSECLSYIYALLNKANIKEIEMLTDDEVPKDDWGTNYICIGGGASNYKSRKLLDVSEPFYKFEVTPQTYGNAIESANGTRKWQPKSNEDFGMIQKLKLNNKTMFLFAGLGPIATAGSGYYLLNNWKNIVKRAGSSEFGILLKFDIVRMKQLPEEIDFIKR